jgi:hypothetical protein
MVHAARARAWTNVQVVLIDYDVVESPDHRFCERGSRRGEIRQKV